MDRKLVLDRAAVNELCLGRFRRSVWEKTCVYRWDDIHDRVFRRSRDLVIFRRGLHLEVRKYR